MGQIRQRLEALRDSLGEIQTNPNHPNAWRNVEFCYLQIRKICECIALSILAAHGGAAEILTEDLRKEWNAGAIFGRLKSLNPNFMPRSAQFEVSDTGVHHAIPRKVNPTADELILMYNQCGEQLHIGSLKSLIREKQPFLVEQVMNFNNRVVGWLESHLIFLPEYDSVLICALRASPSEEVRCHFADGIPPEMAGIGPEKIAYSIDHETWPTNKQLGEK